MTTFLHYTIFWVGFQFFKLTKRTLSYPYYSFRRLFVSSKGKINDDLSAAIRKKNSCYKFENVSGVLGTLSSGDIDKIVSAINRDGFFIFSQKLGAEKVQKLVDYSLTLEATLIPAATDGSKRARYDSGNPVSPKYQFDETSLMENVLIQELATDYSLMAVAQSYLGVKPIQDLTAMWWSTAFSKIASSEAAQLYHFDMDRFKFIKFFFYLTDVDTSTGPHCYIRGTHTRLPEKLWKDDRILDSEITAEIKKEDCIEIVGGKGTIIAVDTRGLHKGKPLERGERLILQFEFTNSLFGAPYEKIDIRNKVHAPYIDIFKKHPHTFQRFKV